MDLKQTAMQITLKKYVFRKRQFRKCVFIPIEDFSCNTYAILQNKDGLIYADLDLIPTPIGNRFVIRGLEDKTNYAMIDLTKTAEPLPSDDEDEDKDNGNMKSPDHKINE